MTDTYHVLMDAEKLLNTVTNAVNAMLDADLEDTAAYRDLEVLGVVVSQKMSIAKQERNMEQTA